MSEMKLKVWRLHPNGVRIVQAEKTLNGTANEGGVKWCQPYSTANSIGWWAFPPCDIDIIWHGGSDFEHRLLSPYTNTEAMLVRSLLQTRDNVDPDKWCPNETGRTKFNFGGVDEGVVQIWTGCIFQTPPGWCLQVRSPANCERQPYRIMEGVLETDWMQYDIWFNLQFEEKERLVQLRRDQWPPLAHLIPIRREAYREEWGLEEDAVNRDDPEANRVFEFWIDYNDKKFSHGGKQYLSATDPNARKDSTTFYRERMKYLGKEMEPKEELLKPKPLPGKKKIKPFCRKKDPADTPTSPDTPESNPGATGGCPFSH